MFSVVNIVFSLLLDGTFKLFCFIVIINVYNFHLNDVMFGIFFQLLVRCMLGS